MNPQDHEFCMKAKYFPNFCNGFSTELCHVDQQKAVWFGSDGINFIFIS